ncbi:MAG: 50S ribosomal protein L25 [Spirochaetaceae bacterium]|nr:50S ribosomal protein L25 [Spirochaetaceae bacterium]
MDKLLLKAEERTDFGKNAMNRLRNSGKIPAVIYGQGTVKHVSVDEGDFNLKFRHISPKTIVPLELAGKKMEILVQDFQHDIVRDKILHIDFYEFVRTASVKRKVTVKLVGTPVGLREGGSLQNLLAELEVEAIERFIPSVIEVNVSSLKVGDSITVADVKAGENAKFVTKGDSVIAKVA